MFLFIYLALGGINLLLLVRLKGEGKKEKQGSTIMKLILMPIAVISWPVYLFTKLATWLKYKRLLKGSVKPFYRFIYSNRIN